MPNILYVHGAYASPTTFRRFTDVLPEHRAEFAEYDCRSVPVDSIVADLAVQARAAFGGAPYAVVGHSLGGLIGLSLYGAGEPVERLFTMSSPFGGSRMATLFQMVFMHMPVFRDICPLGRTVRSLRAIQIGIPMACVVTDGGGTPLLAEANDGVVTVASQTALDGPAYHRLPLNHFEVLLADETLALAERFLFAE